MRQSEIFVFRLHLMNSHYSRGNFSEIHQAEPRSSGAKAENSQNVSFSENREEIPIEAISKGFDIDFPKSVRRRRYLI